MFNRFFTALENMRSGPWRRLVLQIMLFFTAMLFADYTRPLATEFYSGNALSGSFEGACIVVVWTSFILCYRVFFCDRYATCFALVAGVLWICFGDLLVLPFWMGTLGLLIHFYRNRFIPIYLWYIFLIFLAIAAYNDLYNFFAHPVWLTLYGILLISGGIYERRQNRVRRQQEERDVILAEEAKKEQQRLADESRKYLSLIACLEAIRGLSEPVQSELSKIIILTKSILQCMKTDPRDEPGGRQFLDRYLPIVLTIVSKGKDISIQLQEETKKYHSFDTQLEALKQLSSAFQQKHAQMLENETDDLNVEINLLEKLLKTDGFIK